MEIDGAALVCLPLLLAPLVSQEARLLTAEGRVLPSLEPPRPDP